MSRRSTAAAMVSRDGQRDPMRLTIARMLGEHADISE